MMKIKSITHYADYKRGVGISDREYCACDDVTAVSGISLWELVPRIKDWYILDEHLGDDTLVTTDYYDESGRLLVSDKVWVSELRDKKNWKEYLVLYHRRDDPDKECGFSVKAPSPNYALETFYGVICLEKGFERYDTEDSANFKLGGYPMHATVTEKVFDGQEKV